MKKFILTLLVLLSVQTILGQVYKGVTTSFAHRSKSSYGVWSDWSDWKESRMLVVLNFDDNLVTIYSPTIQKYSLIKHIRSFEDPSGGYQIEVKFIDQDLDVGNMRLRREKNGNHQLYIDFNNVMWVYNIKISE